MPTLQCQVHWDAIEKKVVKTFVVLPGAPDEHRVQVQFITGDPDPFIIKTEDKELATSLGLEKAKNAGDQKNLYQVKTAAQKEPYSQAKPAAQKEPYSQSKPAAQKEPYSQAETAPKPHLPCGTLVNGKYVPWGAGLGPDK